MLLSPSLRKAGKQEGKEGRGDFKLVSAKPQKEKKKVCAVFDRTKEESVKEGMGNTFTSSS